jgi:ABC-2 type transport system ATP-binding protein
MQISVKHLQKIYGQKTVLDIASLEIGKGEVVGIVGNNGAGKTTLLRLMLDLTDASEGYCEMNAQKVNESTQWKKETGSFLDDGFLIGFLTPEEYFSFNASTYGLSESETLQRLKEYENFMNNEIINTGKYIRQLSTGNKQKTGIVAALISNPSLIILDEPFNFLDPSSQIIIRNLLKKKNSENGSTILISSHNINHVAEICTRVILLENGKIIKDIETREGAIREIEAYFEGKA